jgi:hypothetical protein
MVYFLALVWIYVILRALFKDEIDSVQLLIGYSMVALIYLLVWTVIFLVLSAFGVITIHWGV